MKTLRFLLKTFWLIFVLIIPTIPVVFYYFIRPRVDKIISVIFLYFIPIVFIVVIVCIIFFVFREPWSLFVLPIGFFATLIFVPIGLSFLGNQRVFGGGIFGEGMATALLLIFYSFPFALISLIVASLTAVICLDKKNNTTKIKDSSPIQKNDER